MTEGALSIKNMTKSRANAFDLQATWSLRSPTRPLGVSIKLSASLFTPDHYIHYMRAARTRHKADLLLARRHPLRIF
jgi:hypothetical protein